VKARDNPFAVERVLGIHYRPQDGTWDDLLARLTALDYRAAIVGGHGTGKSTLLDDLAVWLIKRVSSRCQRREYRALRWCRTNRLAGVAAIPAPHAPLRGIGHYNSPAGAAADARQLRYV
jgi:hypothetical protein